MSQKIKIQPKTFWTLARPDEVEKIKKGLYSNDYETIEFIDYNQAKNAVKINWTPSEIYHLKPIGLIKHEVYH